MSQKFYLILPENYPAKNIAEGLKRAIAELSGTLTVNNPQSADFILSFDLSEKTKKELSEIYALRKSSVKFIFYFLEKVSDFGDTEFLENFDGEKTFITGVPSNLDFTRIYLPVGVDIDVAEDELFNVSPVITIASNSIPKSFIPYLTAILGINETGSGMPVTICDTKTFNKTVQNLTENKISIEKINALRFSANGIISNTEQRKNLFGTSFINIVPFNPDTTDIELREVLLSGGFALAEKNTFLKTAGIPGRDFETFETPEELIEKINFYAKNPGIAQRIRENAILNLSEHLSLKTCAERLKKLTEKIDF